MTAPREAPYEEHTHPEDAWTGFSVQRRLPIPSIVFETITSRAPVATLALFPDISRACITVENRLYLWDYANGQSAFEYHELPSDDLILAVGLVRVRPGVFIDGIKHVLVLSVGPTAVEGRRVTLLGVELLNSQQQQQQQPQSQQQQQQQAYSSSIAGAPTTPHASGSGIKLYETGMSAATNGIVMRAIHGTDSGRVFCVGSDQCVHELVYQAQEGWFRSRCYLYNMTQPHLANLLPSFFKTDKKVSMISIDNARQLLYVLRDGDQIDVYTLGSKDASRAPSHNGSMYGVTRQAGLLHSQQHVGPIVWLGPTEPDPRSSVCLVAVTERGYRLYLDDFQRRSWAQLALRIPPGSSHARSLPTVQAAPNLAMLYTGQGPRHPQPFTSTASSSTGAAPTAASVPMAQRATSALYVNGVFLCAFAASHTMGAHLYAMGPSSPATSATLTYASGVNPAWQEGATLIHLGAGGTAPVLAEAKVPASQSVLMHGAVCRPCAAQTTMPPRVFLVLDANGLTELVERRPADVLADLLGSAASAAASVSSAPAIVDFFSRHGPVEACMCALALAAQNPCVVPRHHARDDMAHAIRVFFGPLGAWPAEQRVPGMQSAHSARYEALACYMACLVRSVWREPLVPASYIDGREPASAAASPPPIVASGRLAAVLAQLTPLYAFMQRHTQLFDDERSERQDVQKWHLLLQRMMEACHFVLFLADHQLRTLAKALPDDVQKRLTNLTFAELVASEQGRSVAQELVTALIESQSGARASVDAIAEALQARCAGFCSADDVRQYKASECLRNATELYARLCAESAITFDAVDEELAQSLHLLLPGAAHLPWDKLSHVCSTYEQLGYVSGVVTLALACARAADPADAAVSFRADGCPPDEPTSHRYAMYTLRRRMYALVLRAMETVEDGGGGGSGGSSSSRYANDAGTVTSSKLLLARPTAHKDAMSLALASDDALFHEELYTYLIAKGRTADLLSCTTPFLADFLLGTPVLLDGQSLETYERRLRDLLWQLYVRQGQYLAAAETLDALAHTDMYPLHLHERIEYLALAVGNAKSVRPSEAAAHVQDLVGFCTQVEEDLEVAQVQAKILSALPRLDTLDCEPEERAQLTASAAQLDRSLMDITSLYKEIAEPFGLLEEQLLILHTAQYQDADLVAQLWEALIAREHNASSPTQAHRAVAALVTDVYVRLNGSPIACALDIVLVLLERYAYDTYIASQGEMPLGSALDWHAFATVTRTTSSVAAAAASSSPSSTSPTATDGPSTAQGLIPPGWAPRVLLEAGAPPDALFHVLQGLLSMAPAPWNTNRGVGFLLPDVAEFCEAWLRRTDQNKYTLFPAHQIEQVLSDALLQLHSRRYTRSDEALDARIEQVQALVHRVRRSF